MNTKTYNKFKTLLTEACDKRVKSGKPIISGGFHLADGCCPIACALGGSANSGRYFERLNKKLGVDVNEEDYWLFINGFDGYHYTDSQGANSRLYKLGLSLRQKYINKGK